LIVADHDNTHFAAPFDPDHGPGTDSKGLEWTADGIKVGGIHGGDPVTTRTVSVIYELTPLEPGSGGTACLSGTHNPGFPRPDFSAYGAENTFLSHFDVQNEHFTKTGSGQNIGKVEEKAAFCRG
jgi:hypothetical protein